MVQNTESRLCVWIMYKGYIEVRETWGRGKAGGAGNQGGLHAEMADRPRRDTPQARDPWGERRGGEGVYE